MASPPKSVLNIRAHHSILLEEDPSISFKIGIGVAINGISATAAERIVDTHNYIN